MFSKKIEEIKDIMDLLDRKIEELTEEAMDVVVEKYGNSKTDDDFETFFDKNFDKNVYNVSKDDITDVEDLINSAWFEEYKMEANYLKAENCKYSDFIKDIIEELGIDVSDISDNNITIVNDMLMKKFDRGE